VLDSGTPVNPRALVATTRICNAFSNQESYHNNCKFDQVGRSKDSDLAGRSDGFVEITCADPSKFKGWDPKALLENIRMLGDAQSRVDASTMTRTRYESLEKSVGFNYNKDGILSDPDVLDYFNPIGTITVDWVHNMLQDGVFTTEVGEIMLRMGAPQNDTLHMQGGLGLPSSEKCGNCFANEVQVWSQ